MAVDIVPREKRGSIQHAGRTYGVSRLGSPLELFAPLGERLDVLVIAGQHGTEPESTALLSAALRMTPVGRLACGVILAVNPDGLARGTRCNAAGVDLNRNFPTRDWSARPTATCWNDEPPRDVVLSSGNAAASEPETRALLDLVNRRRVTRIVSMHAPLGCIDVTRCTGLSHTLSERMELPLVNGVGYPTPGSFGAWASENGVDVITVELPFDSLQGHIRRFGLVMVELLEGEL